MVPQVPSFGISEAAQHYEYKPVKKKGCVRVLSIDGGGVRGIIPSMVLNKIEEKTHQAACKTFDLIAGTSTGAICALGLTIPKAPGSQEPKFAASDIVELYRNRSADVFPKPTWWGKPWFWSRQLEYAKYKPDGLVKVIQEYAGDTLLKDALTEVMAPSQEITESNPWYFQRSVARIDPNFSKLRMVDVIRSSTAAPTFFPPNPMTFGGNKYAFIDGGVSGANTPSVCAYTEAKKLFHKPDNNYLIVSLGTGVCKEKIPYTKSSHWGLLQWTPKLVNVFLQSGSELAHKQMQSLFPDCGSNQHYFRFQTPIPEKNSALDNASKENLKDLEEIAETMMEEQEDKMNRLCEKLDDQVLD